MNYQTLYDNFKCPLCNMGKINTTSTSCLCKKSYFAFDGDRITLAFSDAFETRIYFSAYNYNKFMPIKHYFTVYCPGGVKFQIFLDEIPDWILDDNALSHIETLITFS